MNEVKFDGPLNTGQLGKEEEAGGGCPFCGAPEATFSGDPYEYPANYECGTLETKKRGSKRAPACYERQIEHLQVLLRECWEFFYAFENFEDNMTIPFHIWPSEMLKKIQKLKLKDRQRG